MTRSTTQELRTAFARLGIAPATNAAVRIDGFDGLSDTGRQLTSYSCICWCGSGAVAAEGLDGPFDLAAA